VSGEAMDDFRVDWRPEEREAIKNMAVEHRMSPASVIRQAIRLYHHHEQRLAAGEVCTWSGDADRAKQFHNPDAD
jgi:hypothetical protein